MYDRRKSGPQKKTSQVVLMVKNPPANAGDVRDPGSIPGLRRSPGGGHGNPLQYSCLQNPMDRGAWWATVHRVEKSQTRLKGLSIHTGTGVGVPCAMFAKSTLSHHDSTW